MYTKVFIVSLLLYLFNLVFNCMQSMVVVFFLNLACRNHLLLTISITQCGIMYYWPVGRSPTGYKPATNRL